jgi:hypothetical protein
LAEPLRTDLGAHRWLTAKREEAYSDWLQWVLTQMATSKMFEVLPAFCPNEYANCKDWFVDREVPILDGKRKLDLVVYAGLAKKPVIVVEIKKGDPIDEEQKLKDYGDWAEHENVPRSNRILLGSGILLGTEEEAAAACSGFMRRGWEDVCIAIRKIAREMCFKDRHRVIVGAMMLAFVGAVEQNLLSIAAPSNKAQAKPFSRDWPRIAKHLRRSLGKETGHANRTHRGGRPETITC